MTQRCKHCGETNCVSGSFAGLAGLHFKPDVTPLVTLSHWEVTVDASLCLDCGNIEMFGRKADVSQLRHNMQKSRKDS